MENSVDMLSWLSQQIGTTEPALKLLLSLFAGYPLALIHRQFIYNKGVVIQHLYFIVTGFALGYWNYGKYIFHCILSTLFTYCTFVIFKGTNLSVCITFIFQLSYLLLGYLYTSTANYDINWTLPQCILTLRLIGVAFDLYDGQQPVETLSSESKKLALVQEPSILELFGHSLFPSAFLVGPQFPMKRYLEFVGGEFNSKDGPPNSTGPALKRLIYGLIYLAVFHVLKIFVRDEYLISDEFADLNFFKKMILLGLWGKYTLYKYIFCWLLTEGSCILFGVAHNGKDEKGEPKWDGTENIKLAIFENATEFSHYIKSFNVNTNNWVAQYIYKRLKFLDNRQLSQFASLLFLAIWHGFHSGYYVCFFFEFIVMYMERDIKSIIKSNESLTNFFLSPKLQLPLQIMLRLYTFIFMGWCLLSFGFLQYPKYLKAFSNANYIGVIVFVMWPIVYAPLIRLLLKRFGRRRDE